ncbi:MAG: hypothetical protein PHS74_00465 [Lachnospiraceae bacterium]|nr:hypothetical protein [Lachnospiraceae bacterium]
MNKSLYFVMFALGAATGSVVTWQCLKEQYRRLTQEEIDSVKETFSKKQSELIDIFDDAHRQVIANEAKEKPNITEYVQKLRKEGYVNYSDLDEKTVKKEADEIMEDAPYIITPEEYGEEEEYDQLSLTYYADEILADDEDEIIEDVENVVGKDFAKHFGEYEDDSVFVRNPSRKADYEILLDNRNHSDVIKSRPHLAEE